MKLLIDTNIYIDAMSGRMPWAAGAQALLTKIAEEKAIGCVSASSLSDIYYILKKHLKSNEITKQALVNLITTIDILDVNGTDCKNAFNSPIDDYEDALLACLGERHKVDYLVTRDSEHFKNSSIKVLDADGALKLL